MNIPRILHQTWKTENVPYRFEQMAFSWKKKHPSWEYRFWTDEDNREFIKEHFSFFLDRYDAYATNIQRVDAVRYFTLLQCGGVYIDMDFECLENISPLLGDAKCVFGKEPDEHCSIHGKSMIISNAFMAVVPGHELFSMLCTELLSDAWITDHPNDKVLESTGPFMLTRLLENFHSKKDIKLLDAGQIYPLTKAELEEYDEQPAINKAMSAKLKKAYAIHHYAGTWWKQEQ